MKADILSDLDRLATAIEQSKTNRAKLEGAKEEQLKRLKELGINSIAQAKKELATGSQQKLKLDQEIDVAYDQLKKEYEW